MAFEEKPSARIPCPACGGAGGGPMGRAGSAWDQDDYVCPRCKGEGAIFVAEVASQRPGIVKIAATSADDAAPTQKRKAAG